MRSGQRARTNTSRLRGCLLSGVILPIMLGVAGDAGATGLFVAPAGNDANDCLSPATACQTIQQAVDRAESGSVISVAPGVYAENVNIGPSSSQLRITGGPGVSVVGGGDPSVPIIAFGDARNIEIEGLTISGPISVAMQISGSTNITVRDCTIELADTGVFIVGLASTVKFSHVVIRDNTTAGLIIIGGSEVFMDDLTAGPSVIERSGTGVSIAEGSTFVFLGATRISDNFLGIVANGGTVRSCCADRPPREIRDNVVGIFSRGADLFLNGPGRIEGGAWGVVNRGGFVQMRRGFDIADNTSGIRNRGGHMEIEDIEISGNNGSGITLWDNASLTLNGTTILNNGEDGVQLLTLSTANFGAGTTVQGNSRFDLNCADGSSVVRGDLSGVPSSTCSSPGADLPTIEERVSDLVVQVLNLNLQQGIANSLDAKLDAVLAALQDMSRNDNSAAINKLQAFINAVEAQRGNKVPEADADELIASARAIIALLSV